MFWLRIKKNNFSLHILIWGPDVHFLDYLIFNSASFLPDCLTFGMLSELSLHIFHLCQVPVVQLLASLIRDPGAVGLISARPSDFVTCASCIFCA